jgi:hypothetical protein
VPCVAVPHCSGGTPTWWCARALWATTPRSVISREVHSR